MANLELKKFMQPNQHKKTDFRKVLLIKTAALRLKLLLEEKRYHAILGLERESKVQYQSPINQSAIDGLFERLDEIEKSGDLVLIGKMSFYTGKPHQKEKLNSILREALKSNDMQAKYLAKLGLLASVNRLDFEALDNK
ncbi:hypothetical protein FJZ26_02325 [Candidatus Parvarchaeota archaeon]|nr:hypothetical protein [Candidatus Parvarchaeota archaeon]